MASWHEGIRAQQFWLGAYNMPCLASFSKAQCLFWHSHKLAPVELCFTAFRGPDRDVCFIGGVGEESKISISPRCGSVWRMP